MISKNKDGRFVNYIERDSIDTFIEEIKKCLDANLYMSAFHMALSLPDICSQLEYPNIKKTETRYIKWFDENVKDVFGLTVKMHKEKFENNDFVHLNGKTCYAIRNKLFHTTGNDIRQSTNIDEFVLSFDSRQFLTGNTSGSISEYDENNQIINTKKYLYIGIKEWCLNIINSVSDFKKNHPEYDWPKLIVNDNSGLFPDWLILDKN